MVLKNISKYKDKNMKVFFVVVEGEKLIFANWYVNWQSFIRSKPYQKYHNNFLEYCTIKEFDKEKYYISCCVQYCKK
ncbi:hypothetical protein IKJ53_01090 [bacterium]|nr:hypothetical protein [bacterium]